MGNRAAIHDPIKQERAIAAIAQCLSRYEVDEIRLDRAIPYRVCTSCRCPFPPWFRDDRRIWARELRLVSLFLATGKPAAEYPQWRSTHFDGRARKTTSERGQYAEAGGDRDEER